MSYKVPLRFSTGAEGAGAGTDKQEGEIEYKADKSTLDACPGFFVFTYYIRNPLTGEETFKQTPIYLEGLHAYAKLLTIKEPNPFKSWKLIIYTDEYTYNEMNKTRGQKPNFEEIRQIKEENYNENNNTQEHPFTAALAEYNSIKISQFLLRSKNVVFAIVNWPYYQRNTSKPQINGPALRLMRTRAPFDFPTKYCFARDADTLFEFDIGVVIENDIFNEMDYRRVRFVLRLYAWEKQFFNFIPEIEKTITNPLILGTEIGYLRAYHPNELTGVQPPFGIFAGFTNTTPNIPLYENKTIWNKIIDYVHKRSIKTANGKYTNNGLDTSIGRDEQVFLFFIIAESFKNVFFFNIKYSKYAEENQFFLELSDEEFQQYKIKQELPDLNMDFDEQQKKIYLPYVQTFLNTFKGGRRKSRKLRLKIEKRKSRRHS